MTKSAEVLAAEVVGDVLDELLVDVVVKRAADERPRRGADEQAADGEEDEPEQQAQHAAADRAARGGGVDAVMDVDLPVGVLLHHGHVIDARRVGTLDALEALGCLSGGLAGPEGDDE